MGASDYLGCYLAVVMLSANQPCYLPWCGLFERMARADIHVHLDDVEYVRRTYFNRNRVIDRHNHAIMLTVPVRARAGQPILDVLVDQQGWARKHAATLHHCYASAAHRHALHAVSAVLDAPLATLAQLNIALTDVLGRALGITTPTYRASTLGVPGRATQRLVDLCRHFGADTYYSPAGARAYIEPQQFAAANIRLVFQDYVAQPYPQDPLPHFVPSLSVVDVLVRHGGTLARQVVDAGARREADGQRGEDEYV